MVREQVRQCPVRADGETRRASEVVGEKNEECRSVSVMCQILDSIRFILLALVTIFECQIHKFDRLRLKVLLHSHLPTYFH